MKRRMKEFHVIIEKDEDGFLVADVPELPGCHTQAKSLDKLMKRIHEAVLAYLESKVARSHIEFVGVQRIAV